MRVVGVVRIVGWSHLMLITRSLEAFARSVAMSDFILSIFISIGIVGIATGLVIWLTVRRLREEKARSK